MSVSRTGLRTRRTFRARRRAGNSGGCAPRTPGLFFCVNESRMDLDSKHIRYSRNRSRLTS